MRILIMGPVGSGKSTQAEILAERLNATHLNTGDLLYYASLGDGQEAQEIKETMAKGEMVREEITLRFINEYMETHKEEENIVVDGFPRTLSEAQKAPFTPDKVFYIKVSDKVTTERLLQRGRPDDTPSLIEKRLKVYHEETEPILDHYRRMGVLIEINGEGSVEEVAKNIEEKF